MNNQKNNIKQKQNKSWYEKANGREREKDPLAPDPPVPNRAHTEMRTDFPPEFPDNK